MTQCGGNMSDLKHKNETELRAIIRSCVGKRNSLAEDIAACKKQIEALQQKINSKGRASHNIGQREVWARKYLAEKTLKNGEYN